METALGVDTKSLPREKWDTWDPTLISEVVMMVVMMMGVVVMMVMVMMVIVVDTIQEPDTRVERVGSAVEAALAKCSA